MRLVEPGQMRSWHGVFFRHRLARIFTDNRRGLLGGVLNHEWTRMDTNKCSSGFPARDLSGCVPGDNPEVIEFARRLFA